MPLNGILPGAKISLFDHYHSTEGATYILVSPGNHVLIGGPDPPWRGAILREESGPL